VPDLLRKTVPISVLFFICSALAQAPSRPLSALDPGFRDRALAHVRELSAYGDRVAAGPGETKAAGYVKQQLEKAGLAVSIEPFAFQSFEFEQGGLRAGELEAKAALLVFDPYTGEAPSGELVLADAQVLNSPKLADLQVEGRILVTTEGANPYRLMLMKKPGAIAYLSKDDFARFQSAGPRTGSIAFKGRTVKRSSANVVGVLRPSRAVAHEVILSAHLDSWKGPGANDNASGVAVLLEIARQLAARKDELPFAVKFVAFGAEEFGMLGAKAYLSAHQADLQNCLLLFNIDTVGGGEGIVAQIRGAGPLPDKIRNQLSADLMNKATNDLGPTWVLNDPGQWAIFMTPMVPEWIRNAIGEAGNEIGVPIRGSGGMGSDHAVFLQAGVPATNIAVAGGKEHSVDDTPENVHPEGLENAARVVLSVVDRARIRESAAR
jgi:acetylornithine deacetylase/succinyl-diaminopimelate desuccinylase-like protein